MILRVIKPSNSSLFIETKRQEIIVCNNLDTFCVSMTAPVSPLTASHEHPETWGEES